MRRAAAVALALVAAPCAAQGPYTPTDAALLAASTTLLAADWLQTRRLVLGRYTPHTTQVTVGWLGETRTYTTPLYERNPLLGPTPTLGAVNAYFAATIAGNYAVAEWLGNTPNRTVYLGAVTAIQMHQVWRNYHFGLRIAF